MSATGCGENGATATLRYNQALDGWEGTDGQCGIYWLLQCGGGDVWGLTAFRLAGGEPCSFGDSHLDVNCPRDVEGNGFSAVFTATDMTCLGTDCADCASIAVTITK